MCGLALLWWKYDRVSCLAPVRVTDPVFTTRFFQMMISTCSTVDVQYFGDVSLLILLNVLPSTLSVIDQPLRGVPFTSKFSEQPWAISPDSA